MWRKGAKEAARRFTRPISLVAGKAIICLHAHNLAVALGWIDKSVMLSEDTASSRQTMSKRELETKQYREDKTKQMNEFAASLEYSNWIKAQSLRLLELRSVISTLKNELDEESVAMVQDAKKELLERMKNPPQPPGAPNVPNLFATPV